MLQAKQRVKLTAVQALALLFPYVKRKITEQVKAVWMIIVYLIIFQTVVLRVPIADALVLSAGIALVIAGLAFFMEGLLLGLMPIGEYCGTKLPRKAAVPVILVFAFVLGVGATFAEPAIGVLKAAGSSVRAWDAPLLFVILNKHAFALVLAVALGVGVAVALGMLRFLYAWSLKPFLYVLVGLLLVISYWASVDPHLLSLTGLAWDCGGVTTGPVTVPLVLALGVGISRIVGGERRGTSGLGVVTLASVVPIVAVFGLAAALMGTVPLPMSERAFVQADNRAACAALFESEADYAGYVLRHGSAENALRLFGHDTTALRAFLDTVSADAGRRQALFGPDPSFHTWLATKCDPGIASEVRPPPLAVPGAGTFPAGVRNVPELLARSSISAAQAIIPLSAFLLFVVVVILRERLRRPDEIALGILFAVLGMGIFTLGMETGLSRLGNEVGEKLPAAFKAIALTDQTIVVHQFDPRSVVTAVDPAGGVYEQFLLKTEEGVRIIPFDRARYDSAGMTYTHTPDWGPLFGGEKSRTGILVVLLFAFFLGYGATLAEPALNALGLTVEELTVGSFKKAVLMHSVAIGVGAGMMFGVAKILWDLPLFWILAPVYLLLIPVTKISTEEFVNIGWDSAGVTTGPVTVPLVLALGLGISGQVGVVEGFGILAAASAFPILSVLVVGLVVNRKRLRAVDETLATNEGE